MNIRVFPFLLLSLLPAALPAQINIYLGGIGAGDHSNFSGNLLALPLSLISFTATAEGQEVSLRWDTENELDLERFDLERSPDGREFTSVGSMPAAAASAPGERRRYHFTDHRPLSGIAYYRLRVTELDGSVIYSGVERVEFAAAEWSFGLSPNPSYGGAVVVHAVGQQAGERLRLTVFNALGRVTYTATYQTASADSRIDIPATLPGGSYFVRLQREGGDLLSQKLLVVR